jgi:hypothetical protein
MASGADPLRVLGLAPGATPGDIKQAYRRLAKAYHPDTAGEAAIPRFLAIQAAYDELMGSSDSGPSATPWRRTTARPSWWADPERAARTRRARGAGATGTSDAGRRRRSSERSRRTDRPPDRATPGSTTYDEAEADADPYDRDWEGASWYGTTSGTYWTINPKEYADPRKHGPEYQARARRGWTSAPGHSADGGAASSESFAGDAGEAAADPAAGSDAADGADPLSALPLPGGAARRLVLALIGWPPLGIGLAWLIGEASGCGRFAAGCVETFALGTWAGQVAVLALLVALPPLASVSAVGTIVMLAASIPAAVILSAAGALAVVLAAAWLVGVGFAVGRRARGWGTSRP